MVTPEQEALEAAVRVKSQLADDAAELIENLMGVRLDELSEEDGEGDEWAEWLRAYKEIDGQHKAAAEAFLRAEKEKA